VAVVAGGGEQEEAGFESGGVLFFYSGGEAVERGLDHGEGGHFGAIGTIMVNIVEGLFDLAEFEAGEVPVGGFAGEPELFVVDLDAGHEFAEAGSVDAIEALLKALDLGLESVGVGAGLGAGDSQTGANDEQPNDSDETHEERFYQI